MMDLDSPSLPPRVNPARVAENNGLKRNPFSAPNRPTMVPHVNNGRDAEMTDSHDGSPLQPAINHDAASLRINPVGGHASGRDAGQGSADASPSQAAGYLPPFRGDAGDYSQGQSVPVPRAILPPSSSNSQDTSSTNEGDLVFTPAVSDGGMSAGNGNGQDSSQESQLLQLSHLAAAREKIAGLDWGENSGTGMSRKRMADGAVKHTRSSSSASPVHAGGHSRNTSTVSVASTSSRIGELSAELKARLSYAMVKVNHGWQSHSIDQVESLASQGVSPTSSTSTIHLRQGSSASPQLSDASRRDSIGAASGTALQFRARLGESHWRETNQTRLQAHSASPVSQPVTTPALAPPVSIQPARPTINTRRNSNPRYTPTFLSHSHQASPTAGPHTPGQTNSVRGTPNPRGLATPIVDPILFSPHQNVREQDAIESLLFMSSPGNSANLKHTFPASSSQPLPSGHDRTPGNASSQRRALPTSQPRRSLPSGRPAAQNPPSHAKRVDFEKSPSNASDMDVDQQFGTPHSRGTPKRKVNGASHGVSHLHEPHAVGSRLKPLPVSAGLVALSRPRPALADEDIERMLDRVADDSSDSDGEIQIPAARSRRGVTEILRA